MTCLSPQPTTSPFPARGIPWLQAGAADVNALCADTFVGQSLTLLQADVKTLASPCSTVATQLTADSLTLADHLTATSLVAESLTTASEVAISKGALLGSVGLGPQLIPVVYMGPTNPFVLQPNLALGCTVLFSGETPSGASCLLPSSPAAGLSFYVANASAANSVLIMAPGGVSLASVSTPDAPGPSLTLEALKSTQLLWSGELWVASPP